MFSFYDNTRSIQKKCDIELSQFVKAIKIGRYKKEIEELRSLKEKSARTTYKAKMLPAVTVSGVFKSAHKADEITEHSGLIQIDIDEVNDVDQVRSLLYADTYTRVGFVSPSGTGIKLIVAIDGSQHKECFFALEKYYKDKYNIIIDKACKDVCRLCFFSADSEIYYNEKSEVFSVQNIIKKEAKNITSQPQKSDNNIEILIDEIIKKKIDITNGYEDWIKIGFALANEYGENGYNYFDAISQISSKYNSENCRKQYTECVKNQNGTVKIASLYHIAKNHGIIIKKQKQAQAKAAHFKTPNFEQPTDENGMTNEELEMYHRYGFYIYKKKYFFYDKGKFAGNFILTPLFHVKSNLKTKRLFAIENEHNIAYTIEFEQKELISLAAFKLKVESLGNFSFDLGEEYLNKIKKYLYDQTDSCREIDQLGWQREGFFAFCNGVLYKEQFYPISHIGIVKLDIGNFYIPANSDFYKDDHELFTSERMLKYRKESNISMYELTRMLVDCYDDNAIVLFCFYICTIYRDLIVKKRGSFPILNLFGLKGSGKTQLFRIMQQAFGEFPDNAFPMLNSVSISALGKYVAQYANVLCPIDEYKNSLTIDKIEYLKGLYNSTGRKITNMDINKTETTRVNCGIILAGQEMPTADIALFSRVLYCTFGKTEHSDEEKVKFSNLLESSKKGYTNITVDLLNMREHFIARFNDAWTEAENAIKNLSKQNFDDRVFENWVAILAGYLAVHDRINLYFSKEKIIELFTKNIERQNEQLGRGNEVSQFWQTIEYLFQQNFIYTDVNFRIKGITELKLENKEVKQFHPYKNIIFMDLNTLIFLYRKHAKGITDQVLPQASIEFYLRNSKEFLGRASQMRFKTIDPFLHKVNEEIQTAEFDEPQNVKYRTVRPWAFDYDLLVEKGINLHQSTIVNQEENDFDSNQPIFDEQKIF